MIAWLRLLLASVSAFPVQEYVWTPTAGDSGAVASESIICSQIGIDLMRRGGNAVDALVGTTLCVGVIAMYHSGIGGGGFMLVRDSEGVYEMVDFRETAPAAAFEDMYNANPKTSEVGGLSVGVPGELRGLEYVHKKHGVLPWRAVVNPAAHLARNGFNVTEDLARYMAAVTVNGTSFLAEEPVWAEEFAPNGTLLKVGDTIKRVRIARTLERIAAQGASAFYEGEIAEDMIATIQANNGTMTLGDLAGYNITIREAIQSDFRGFKLYATGAPSSGAVTLAILKTMEQYPSEDWKDVNLTTHRLAEAMRYAYAARMHLGDPTFIPSVSEMEEAMASDSRARKVRKHILDNTTQPVQNYDPQLPYVPESHGTSHVVTTDRTGMAVSLTTTINLLFGSRLMTPGSGIILNDQMNDFSIPGVSNVFGFPPSAANFVRPGKRPLSSITPIMVETPSGELYLVTGAAGGSRIISSTAQTVYRVLEGNTTLRDAIAGPRLHDQLVPDTSVLELSFDKATAASLGAKGHKITWVDVAQSAVQGIRRVFCAAQGTFQYEAVGETRQIDSGGLTVQ